LTVEPPVLASWRWAGTSELVGEPLAPLPRSTRYRVTITDAARAVDGRSLMEPHSFEFTTPLPECRVILVPEETGEELAEALERRRRWSDKGEREVAPGQALALVFDQPVDAGSLFAALSGGVAPRPLEAPRPCCRETNSRRSSAPTPRGLPGGGGSSPQRPARLSVRPRIGCGRCPSGRTRCSSSSRPGAGRAARTSRCA
jgi:hypothetical protein